MGNNKKSTKIKSACRAVILELIRQLPMQLDIWRLEKQVKELKSQNLELTSRLAAVEKSMSENQTKKQPARQCGWKNTAENADTVAKRQAFRIHDADYRHIGQVNLTEDTFSENTEELNTAMRRAADLLKREFRTQEKASRLKIVSDVTGKCYELSYDKDIWPKTAFITLTASADDENGTRFTFHDIENAAAWIIERDSKFDFRS